MNYRMIFNVLGKTLILEGIFLFISLCVGLIYKDGNYMAFLCPMIGVFAIGGGLCLIKTKNKSIYAKEGLIIVALVWILFSLVGAFPFVLCKELAGNLSYIDAVFETVSGFTTTGGTIFTNVEILSKGIQFWRLFTHWIGGMGVLVFVLAVIPKHSSGFMHLFRAEAPGHAPDKLVSKVRRTALILYGIYASLTLLEVILLRIGGMPLYDSLLHSFSTAGTGGFGIHNQSIAYYNSAYIEIVISIFMFLFGINFNFFYLILIGRISKAFKMEEVRHYVIIMFIATLVITINILSVCDNFGQALRYAFFQVSSVGSTTGFYCATNYGSWPVLSRSILLILTVIGACGGSTGGGLKVARLSILCKSSMKGIRGSINPNSVRQIMHEGEVLDKKVEHGVRTYFIIWVGLVILATLLLSIDGVHDVYTNFTSSLSCIGNVGFNVVGENFCYATYSPFSKIILSMLMLGGRLEIFPILILFIPRTWRRG